MKNSCWIVEERFITGKWRAYILADNRELARNCAKYYNGFSHRTKKAKYRVRRYVEV